jgi:beta-N-acetylhexosaminidase
VAVICAVVGTVHVLRNTGDQDPSDSAAATTSEAPTEPAVAAPRPTGDCVQDQLNAMARPERRIAQLLLLGVPATAPGRAATTAVGHSAPGGVFLTGRSTTGVDATANVVDGIRATGETAFPGVGMFIAVDQEGGQVQVLRGPGFDPMPSAIEQGKLGPGELEAKAATWGGQLRSAGINVNLAPVADVLSPKLMKDNAPLGRFDRAFSSNLEVVASHVSEFVTGMKKGGIATTAKHFPGLGYVRENTDFSKDVTDTMTTLEDKYLRPFRRATQAQTDWMMISSATYENIDPSQPGAFSQRVVASARGLPGFTGLVVSDDFGNAAQVKYLMSSQRAVKFIDAGGDIILTGAPADLELMISGLQAEAAKRPDFADKLHNAEYRVLKAKKGMGLLQCR